MAENSDGQDKSEEPTGKRLQDARSKGQVPRSKELATMAMMMAGAASMILLGEQIIGMLTDLMRWGFQPERDHLFDTGMMFIRLKGALLAALEGMSLFYALMVVVAVAANIAMSGWIWSTQSMGFKFSKLNPISGLKRLFGVNGLMELGKSIIKFVLIMSIAVAWLWHKQSEILGLGRETVEEALAHTADIIFWTFLLLSFSLIILVIVDVPYQLWNHKRQLKMTKQEVKEERKNTDGNPEVKGRIRRLQMEAAIRRMMAAVPEADVVVTNPTHYAVALKYDPDNMRAPLMVAKGADLVAARIRAEAEEHNVPILQAPPLARAIYFSTELDHEIPVGLYMAVAQILAYVFQLKNGETPADPKEFVPNLPIPEEFLKIKPDREPGPGEEPLH